MTTKISGSQITDYTIETPQLSNTAVASFAQSLAPKVLYANVANSAFTVLDDTAVNVGGGYIVVTGSEFQSGATVLIDTTPASAVTFVNSTTLRVQVPTKAAASYNLYVVNPDGGVGVKVSGITYSSEPTWVTSSPLSNQAANTSFNVTLSATGASSYSVAAGSTLPAGTSLLANGYFSGTVTIGAETTYSFSIVATDSENQDSSKTFSVTITVGPPKGLWLWGSNTYGGLGLNDTVNRSSPVQVGSDTNWQNHAMTRQHSLAIKTNGTLWTWGLNDFGQLGQNDTAARSSPVQVGSGTDWVPGYNLISRTGYRHCAAIKSNGTLWTWGRNNPNGQLGLNSTVNRSSPTQVGSSTNWSKIFVSGDNDQSFSRMLAIKTDGTLWGWGYNNSGELGILSRTAQSSPVQVGSNTNWSFVDGQDHTIAIKTDGTLWTWGSNQWGPLGHNDVIYKSSPTQVGSATNWSVATMGCFSALAIKTDGTLWGWGANWQGQLGLNSRQSNYGSFGISSPTQVGSSTTWSQVRICAGGVGAGSVVATKTDGTLWAWGNAYPGTLGQNDTIARSSPTQIGTATGWSQKIVAGSGVGSAIRE